MVIGEPKTFYDSVKPIVYFNCLVGMGAHRQSVLSDTTYFYMQIYTIIVVLINWTMIYIGLTAIIDPSFVHKTTAPAVSITMYYILSATNSCIGVTYPFLIWLQKKGLQDCLRQMPILDDTFHAVLGAPKEYRKRYIHMTRQVLAIVLAILVVGVCDTPLISKQSLFKGFAILYTVNYPIIVMLTADSSFCSYIGYLQKKFRDINDCLLRLSKNSSAHYPGKKIFAIPRRISKITPACRITADVNADSLVNDKHHLLYEVRKAHLELCKLSRKINLAFGIQNLISMGTSFVMVTGFLYNIYRITYIGDFAIHKLRDLVTLVTLTVIYTCRIWFVNHMCESVSKEAKETGDVIYELLESKVDKKLQREIQRFCIQMLQNPVRFDACGFCTLDFTLVQGVTGSITTYLVILIQMSHVSDPALV